VNEMLGSTTGNSLHDHALQVAKRVKATGFDYAQFPKVNVAECNLCGSVNVLGGWELYSHRDRYGLPVRSMRCNDCGLIFLTPRMNEKSYDLFYSDWYRKLIGAFNGQPESEVGESKSWDIQADVVMKFLAKHMPQITINKMLDVGGSTGVFAEKVKNTIGCESVVVDPNKHEIAKAIDRGLTCCCSSFMEYKTDKRFELVSMLRTVEHLPDISLAMSKIRGLLTDNGMFLIDIVNHDWLLKMFHDKSLCTKVDHIYQLTDTTIRQYFDKWFPGWTVTSGDVSARYILYLVVAP
jgi:2-polyprenyl-3-methyl-5-hydroxy-6-metoxy-1,4-benzoquinol methylase